jgi:hypothetical protein
VAGNGPNVLESLQRSHKKLSETQLSLGYNSDASAPLSAPRFPDSRIERPSSSGGRPSTAPHPYLQQSGTRAQSVLGESSSRSGGLKPRLIGVEPKPAATAATVTPTPGSRHMSLGAPLPPFARVRHVSNSSISSNKAFVDILDAQSEIRPANFHKRVQAAGARDYGEDVADRNIGENGLDLNSAPVQAFYAATVSGSHINMEGAPAPDVAKMTQRDVDDELLRIKLATMAQDNYRPRSQGALTSQNFPKRTSSFVPVEKHAMPIDRKVETDYISRINRRQTMGVYITSSANTPTMSRRGKSRPTSFHREYTRIQDDSQSQQGEDQHQHHYQHQHQHQHQQRQRPVSSNGQYDAVANQLGIFTTPNLPASAPMSPKMPRDSVILTKNRSETPQQRHNSIYSDHSSSERPSTARPHSRRGSVASPAFSFPHKSNATKRHSMSSISGETSRHLQGFRNDWPSRHSKVEGGYDTRGMVGRVEAENLVDANSISPAPSPR